MIFIGKPRVKQERIVVLVVMNAVVPGAVPPHARVVGHGELLHGVGVDGRGLVHNDTASSLVGHLGLAGKLS